jgi:hypothetical protein
MLFSTQFCSDVCKNNLQLQCKNDYLKQEDESIFDVIPTSFRVLLFLIVSFFNAYIINICKFMESEVKMSVD